MGCPIELLSIYLSQILDIIGVNEDSIRTRRRMYLEAEAIREMTFELADKVLEPFKPIYFGAKVYHFGSQTEGTTTFGLKADRDFLNLVENDFNCLSTVKDAKFGKTNLLITQYEKTPCGHCLLERLDLDFQGNTVLFKRSGLFFNRIAFDLLRRKISIKLFMPMEKHGPSMAWLNTDNIIALNLPSWSYNYSHLAKYKWPPRNLSKRVRKCLCLLVPTGYHSSDTSNLEWRISTSLGERELMFSLNITQIRCVVLLKMITKSFIEPLINDRFSSFHCKTVLFHTIAKTPSSLWTPDQLVTCLLCCFDTLLHFLNARFCPNFLNPDINLFVGKLSFHSCQKIVILLSSIRSDGLRCLLKVKVDDLGNRLVRMFGGFRGINICPFSNTPQGVCPRDKLLIETVSDRNQQLFQQSEFLYWNIQSLKLKMSDVIVKLITVIKELLRIMRRSNATRCKASRSFLPHISSFLASVVAAYRIKLSQPVTQNIIHLFQIGFQTDATSNKLKLASVYFCNGQFLETLRILKEVRNNFSISLYPHCKKCLMTFLFPIEEFYEITSERVDISNCFDTFTSCVQFTKYDIWCCPPGLRKSVLLSEYSKTDMNPFFVNIGREIDSEVFLCYLEFLTYASLGENSLKMQALHNIVRCTIADPILWKTSFFNIINKDDDGILEEFISVIDENPNWHNTSYESRILEKINREQMTIVPFGRVSLGVAVSFRKCCSVFHMDIALILDGHCFELENKKTTAAAFYWMSFLVDSQEVTMYHIVDVRPQLKTYLYSRWRSNDAIDKLMLRHSEVELLYEIVDSMLSVLNAGIDQNDDTPTNWRTVTDEARLCVCVLNAFIRNVDASLCSRNKTPRYSYETVGVSGV